MTNKFHVTQKGDVRPCRAKSRPCPLGGEHFTDKSEAEKHAEEKLKQSLAEATLTTKRIKKLAVDSVKFDEERYMKLSNDFISKLTNSEKEALSYYVVEGYQEINESLYENGNEFPKLNKNLKDKIEAIDNALKKYSGAPETLWRNLSGNTLPKNFVAQDHSIGDTLDFHGFSSASETPSAMSGVWNRQTWYMQEVPSHEWEREENSRKIKVPETYMSEESNNVIFKIKASSAAPVSMLRGRATEQEFLIPRGRKFRITNIHKNAEITGGNMRSGTFANIYEIEEI